MGEGRRKGGRQGICGGRHKLRQGIYAVTSHSSQGQTADLVLKEVLLRISCPPTISPCFYGVDTPSKRDLIAANQSVEEIRRYIEADSLAYLSLDGLLECCRGPQHTGFCTACYTGNYPTPLFDADAILPAVAVV